MSDYQSQLRTYIQDQRPNFEDLLGQMVEVPSVSSDPEHAPDMHRMAQLAVQYLERFGGKASIVNTKGYPSVAGEWVAGRQYPSLTIYNHLDVQPALEPEWRQPPFAFKKDGDRYCGRGATDDKGPALTALFAANFAREAGIPLNIRVLWELEEEIASPNFSEVLQNRRAVPPSDSVLVSDTIWVAKNRPALSSGLRGLLIAKLVLRTGETDVHSGLTGGGARNPLAELCDAAYSCLDAKTGRVKIPGFYDDVVPPTRTEMKNFLASGFQVRLFKEAYQLRSLRTSDPQDLLKRIWAAPTFEVHGLTGGHMGPGVKTIVPAWGELKVSMRLVPNQHPSKIFRLLKKHLRARNPDIEVINDGELEPYRGISDGPYAEALQEAVAQGFGRRPVFVREGGSIGAIAVLQRAWKVPILFMGLSLPEHGYHAPNEYFDWGQASGGIQAFVHYFDHLSRMQPGKSKTRLKPTTG
ncbi:M20/M25/M40 family metallo-hydrolase [uncultured Nitrospira sp.]|uniref:M20/M25/M40 family metallo-hydrolase n=1 Tax=uncultured Nitrospira sp. TaxID=157176 RepID=UPI0031406F6F